MTERQVVTWLIRGFAAPLKLLALGVSEGVNLSDTDLRDLEYVRQSLDWVVGRARGLSVPTPTIAPSWSTTGVPDIFRDF